LAELGRHMWPWSRAACQALSSQQEEMGTQNDARMELHPSDV